MPEKTLTVATYAAGASLAAVTLIYVFAPTFFLDGVQSGGYGLLGASSKKKAVGLVNPANDCFINSVLQALAGLGDLRLYLIRELHRRNLDDAWIYERAVPADTLLADAGTRPAGAGSRTPPHTPEWKIEGLQSGLVTKSLKEILDALNERPIQKKTISAAPFVRSLEAAFRQRISRQQQDAQELLQVVAERLCDEYHAGRRARLYARQTGGVKPSTSSAKTRDDGDDALASAEVEASEDPDDGGVAAGAETTQLDKIPALEVPDSPQQSDTEDEPGFPMEGAFESQIECLTCGFKPRPTRSTFCTLTLNVPQTTATSLNACFDGMFKTEYIDDFRCANCRLLHAITALKAELRRSTSEQDIQKATVALEKLSAAVKTDPEKPPADVALPDIHDAPKRRIARHIRMVDFPKILAIHLSRSIYDSSHTSLKNSAKVAFPERLPLGGLLQQRKYQLLGLVTHKGSHQSGHYESFRRQNLYPPFANADTFRPSGVYSSTASPISTPRLSAVQLQQKRPQQQAHSGTSSPLTLSSPDLLSPASGVNSSTQSLESSTMALGTSARGSLRSNSSLRPPPAPTSAPRETGDKADAASLQSATSKPLGGAASASGSPSPNTDPRSPSPGAAGLDSAVPSLESLLPPTTAGKSSPSPSPSPARAPSTASPVRSRTVTPTQQQQQLQKPPLEQKARLRKPHDRWWRISDEKIKEANTREVLGMQREVYLLFYELERERPY